ncbi:MAG: hypothetical protein KGJ79_02980 [Alphaproteobacteria bacterium]|nr:hypothetical protein [Alphaproteobacteria bacterium]MDE2110080.1 hypothetical protein [Alphaproteobacteria bacterium]MDE2495106.1 hypothetical protein [Alphaproteobacteria bacterium]
MTKGGHTVRSLVGEIPVRLQLAGGWIDQPFVSKHHPKPPGSMVVVQIEPNFLPFERSGLAGSTRVIAARIWNGRIPDRPLPELVRELYAAENEGTADPSGSQDMIGIIYPGVNRLDYDYRVEGGVFPSHIESCNDAGIVRWLEQVLYILPVNPRPAGYSPLGVKNFDPEWVAQLGLAGWSCFDAIRQRDVEALGASFNLNMRCWEVLLPHVVRHPLITIDLMEVLQAYQHDYPGAMYSGCGGGYLIVASQKPVPGAFHVNVRTAPQ